jgi:multicomponent Na+:H+ antiporter subunit D
MKPAAPAHDDGGHDDGGHGDDQHGGGQGHGEHEHGEAPLFCLVPLCLTAVGCVVLFFQVDGLYELLAPLTRGGRG